MAEFGQEVLTNDEDQLAIRDGPGFVPDEAGVLAPGSAHAHYHNPPGGFSGKTAGAAEEAIGGAFDGGNANKSDDVGVGEGRGMTMEEIQGAVEQLTKGQALITEQIGLLIGAIES